MDHTSYIIIHQGCLYNVSPRLQELRAAPIILSRTFGLAPASDSHLPTRIQHMKSITAPAFITESANYKWWAFGTIAIGTFMSVVSGSGLAVALPTIADHFHTDLPTAQWIFIGEILAISTLLLPAGRLSDIVGRKQVYLGGFVIFILASVIAGYANSMTMLIAAKVLQGAGSAMIQANGMAMIVSVFPEGERGKALGSHMSVVGVGAISGPALGGLLVSAFDWPAVFLINVPVGIIAIAAAAPILDNARIGQRQGAGPRARFDWLGAALSVGGLLAFLLTLTTGNDAGWGSAVTVTGMAVSAALAAGFVWWELRTPSPMLDIRLFKGRVFALGVASGWLSFLGIVAGIFLMPIYLQKVLGFSPGESGLILIPGALCMTFLGPLSGRLSDRFGWRSLTVSGMGLSAAGLFLLSTTLSEDSSLTVLIPILMLQFVGLGFFNSPNTSALLSTVDRSKFGVVSALTQLMRNSATVTGIAFVTAVVVASMESVGAEPSLEAVSSDPEAFISGFNKALLILGFLMVAGMFLALLRGERPRLAPAPAV